MSYELKKSEAVPEGIRRIVCERIDKALQAIDRRKTLPDEAVHEARRRFKQIRGVLRLVREELGDKRFRKENQTFRDAGRPLSAVRDAKVLIDTLDALLDHFKSEITPKPFEALRNLLVANRRVVRKQVLERDRAGAKIRASIRAARKRIDDWPLRHKGWKAISGGIRLVYQAGRTAMEDAIKDGSEEMFHEWRKRSKDLRYEIEVLCRAWPELMQPMADQAHQLTNLLGDNHDLDVLRQFIKDHCDQACSDPDRELLLALIDRRRDTLRDDAIKLGQRVYEESEDDFVDRIKGYWDAWR